jgi:hypothetical protein
MGKACVVAWYTALQRAVLRCALQNGDLLETVEGVDMPKICDLILLNS